MSPERDYPIGHPAASDYKGGPCAPRRAPFVEAFPPGHPARGGKDVGPLDTPDGMRAAHLKRSQDLQELAAVGSLPPLVDDETGQALELTPEQLAHVYATRKGLRPAVAQQITDRYRLEPEPKRKGEEASAELTPEEQAVGYIVSLGYTPERAQEIFDKYGAPSILADKEADAHR